MLRDFERAVVTAAADALLPAGGPIGPSGREAGVVEYLEAYWQRAPRGALRLMRLMLWSVELAPLMFGPRRRRFTRLEPADRRRFLYESSRSDLYLRRVVFLSLRVLLTLAYLADRRVVQSLGIGGDLDPFGLERAAPELPVPKASETRLKDGAVLPDDAGDDTKVS